MSTDDAVGFFRKQKSEIATSTFILEFSPAVIANTAVYFRNCPALVGICRHEPDRIQEVSELCGGLLIE